MLKRLKNTRRFNITGCLYQVKRNTVWMFYKIIQEKQ